MYRVIIIFLYIGTNNTIMYVYIYKIATTILIEFVFLDKYLTFTTHNASKCLINFP